MNDKISISELEAAREKMTPLELRVHRCGYQSRDEACGICTRCNESVRCGSYADVIGSDARDECSHPGSADDISGLVATHNAAPALIAIAKAAMAVMALYDSDARAWFATAGVETRDRLRDALQAVSP